MTGYILFAIIIAVIVIAMFVLHTKISSVAAAIHADIANLVTQIKSKL